MGMLQTAHDRDLFLELSALRAPAALGALSYVVDSVVVVVVAIAIAVVLVLLSPEDIVFKHMQ